MKKPTIVIEPGRYVVAVSGGVDSVVLLHLLQQIPGLQLTVAHFDHGIRDNSADDRRFVRDLARSRGLPFVHDRAELGAGASEAVARQVRYEFLHKARVAAAAQAVVTAHHMDDALETAILNIIRGTGRRGLTSLRSTDVIKRPLLHVPKTDIVRYARDNQFLWQEDSTNKDDAYKRNYVRHKLLDRFDEPGRQALHQTITDLRGINDQLDSELGEVLQAISEDNRIERKQFIMLPHAVAREIMASWLREKGVEDIDSKMLERLVRAAKIHKPGGVTSVGGGLQMKVTKDYLALEAIERYNRPVYG